MLMTKQDESYTNNLRGNQDIFLANLMNSPEFIEIRDKHLSGIFTGIERLLGKVVDEESKSSKRIRAATKEISVRFKLKEDVAIKLLLSRNQTLPMHLNYIPKVYQDGEHV